MQIAIIGAGIAGLSCAQALAAAGHRVALFDKGRGPGGRMSTRRVEAGGATLRFDHGAQYFTVRDPAFRDQVARWAAAGHAAPWAPAGPDAWVGTPAMNAPVRALAADHAVTWGAPVTALIADGAGWRLEGVEAAGGFDGVIVAVPAEQAAPLLEPHAPGFAATARACPSAPCWTVMAAFARPLPDAPEVLRGAGPIGWAARDGAKPGRGDAQSWVIQATPDWSAARIEAPGEAVAAELLAAFAAALGAPLPAPIHLAAHRWRYARSGAADATLGGALWDAGARLGACGDWLTGPRVEAAWLSGRQLAARISPA